MTKLEQILAFMRTAAEHRQRAALLASPDDVTEKAEAVRLEQSAFELWRECWREVEKDL